MPFTLKQPSPGVDVRELGGVQKLVMLLIVQLGVPHSSPDLFPGGAIVVGLISNPRL